MALTASAMAYSWSKWNNEREREEVIFQAAEALEDEPLLEVIFNSLPQCLVKYVSFINCLRLEAIKFLYISLRPHCVLLDKHLDIRKMWKIKQVKITL